jgi:amino acid adenylation domain-containing protein
VAGEEPSPEEMERSLPAIIAERASERPGAVAIEEGERRLTYAELEAAGVAIASGLLGAGVGPGDVVAVCLPRSLQTIEAFLGCLRAGAAYVPINPENPPLRQQRIVELADTGVALTAPGYDAGLPSEVLRLNVGELTANDPDHLPEPPPGGDRVAQLLFTSGSTGEPKGVEISHRNLLHLLRSRLEAFPRWTDTVLHVCPVEFDMATLEVWGALLNGARIVIAPQGRPDPAQVGQLIRERGVTVVVLPTGVFHEFVLAGVLDLGAVRAIVVGGDVLSPAVVRALLGRHPGVRVFNGYGPTETTVLASSYEVTSSSPAPVPIGRPLPGYLFYVLDEAGAPVGPGESGELWIGGPGVTRGYRRDPEQTAKRYRTNPFGDGRIYRSGDRVRLSEDGELLFEGRLDRQVKIAGQRVELGEIEQVLASHPEVGEAAVVAREDVPGHKWLVGYVLGADGLKPAPAPLRDYLVEHLTRAMVPNTILVLDSFPRTERGKVDRSALPAPVRGEARALSVDGLVEEVGSIVAEALYLDYVGPEENFFELGGDSLLAIRLASRLRERLGVELEIGIVFDAPTVAELAKRIEANGSSTPAIPPLLPGVRSSTAPVSFAQRRTWLFELMHPDSITYQSSAMIEFDGPLDEEALAAALADVMQRHESLRTSFGDVDGEPVQIIHPALPAPLETIDLRGRNETSWEELLRKKVRTRIDPSRAPLVRWTLVRREDSAWTLIQVEHHLIRDGWSFAVLTKELAELYSAKVENRRPELPELVTEFQDYARWERGLLESDEVARQLEHWKVTLDRDPPLLELPLDRPRSPHESFVGHSIRCRLEPETAGLLRELAHVEGGTLFMAAYAAFATQLQHYSGHSDLQIGSGLANRREPASEHLIGMIVNTVVFRFDLSGDPTVRELLRRARAVALDAYANADVPFDAVVETLRPPRGPERSPLFNVLFSFHDVPHGEERWSGLRTRVVEALPNGTAKSDLDIIGIDDKDGGITFVWEHSDLFTDATAERMAHHHLKLIEEFTRRPDARISELELLPEDELEQLEAWESGKRIDYEREATIADLFEARATESPLSPALTYQGETLSYRVLDRRANRLAHHLRELGVDRGARVGVYLDRSLDLIIALLAVTKAGGTYVPLDPDDSTERLRGYAETLDLRLVVTDSRHRLSAPGPAGRLTIVDELADLAREPDSPPDRVGSPLDAAYIMFTSGSTGVPKGVEVSHRAIVRLVRGADYVRLDGAEVVLGMAPAAFDASTFEIWGSLCNGAHLVLAPPGALTLGELEELVTRERVTTMWLPAGLFHLVVDNRPEVLGNVRQLLAGGDVLSPDHVGRALAALPEGAVLVNGYGPTEATTFSCTHSMRKETRIGGAIPIGRPVPGTSVYILDASGHRAPIGVTGELYIGGDGVALGYAGDHRLTRERFLSDPFSGEAGARMYRSGDLARWRTDGTVEFLGRADRQLKVRGFRVEPGEIEEVLRGHDQVADAYVTPFEDPPGNRALAAYIVLRSNSQMSEPELRAHAARLLPAYAIPVAWHTLERLPLSNTGKVDVAALPPPVVGSRRSGSDPSKPARDGLERELVAIWKRVLGCDPIDPEDDFFEVGGHSLLAVELFDQIERSLGEYLPLATIFEAPTVRRLASIIRRSAWDGSRKPLVPVTTTGRRPPLFCISAGDGNPTAFGALARRLGDDQPLYALQPRGLYGGAPLFTSVEAAARRYLTEILKVQPHGPYLLAGRCLGSAVAYEMARRIEARGEKVALLLAMDSAGPWATERRLANGVDLNVIMINALRRSGLDIDIFSPGGTEAFMRWLAEPAYFFSDGRPAINRYLEEIYLLRAEARDAYPDLNDNQTALGYINWVWDLARTEGGVCLQLLPPPSDPALLFREPRRWSRRLRELGGRVSWRAAEAFDLITFGRLPGACTRLRRRIDEASRHAWVGYRAGEYSGTVTIVRSAEFRVHRHLDRWYALAAGSIAEVHITGTHRSMLREPDVASLAEAIKGLIDAAITDRNESPELEARTDDTAAAR